MRPYAGERWWPLALSLVAAAGLVAAAVALRARRDEGAGLIEPRPGPATARPSLTRPLGLAAAAAARRAAGLERRAVLQRPLDRPHRPRRREPRRRQRRDRRDPRRPRRGDIVDQYFAVSMLTMALIGAGFGVQVALRMRSEETSGRLEPLLATALSRRAWAGAYVVVAMAGSTLVLAANGIGAGLADAINSDDASQLPRLLAAAVVPAPAVWVVSRRRSCCSASCRARPPPPGACSAPASLLVVLGPLLGPAGVGARPVAVRARPAAARRRLQRRAAAVAERGRPRADRARPARVPPPRPRALGRLRVVRLARLPAAHVDHVAGEQELAPSAAARPGCCAAPSAGPCPRAAACSPAASAVAVEPSGRRPVVPVDERGARERVLRDRRDVERRHALERAPGRNAGLCTRAPTVRASTSAW